MPGIILLYKCATPMKLMKDKMPGQNNYCLKIEPTSFATCLYNIAATKRQR